MTDRHADHPDVHDQHATTEHQDAGLSGDEKTACGWDDDERNPEGDGTVGPERGHRLRRPGDPHVRHPQQRHRRNPERDREPG